jgi:hypothetical protein
MTCHTRFVCVRKMRIVHLNVYVCRAIDGKLDPVIGRDEEISRVIRVLARRMSSAPVHIVHFLFFFFLFPFVDDVAYECMIWWNGMS